MPANLINVYAEDDNRYVYTLFASSASDGSISFNANNVCVNGNLATNGTVFSSGTINVNGEKVEKANLTTPDLKSKIQSKYFSGSYANYSSDCKENETNFNWNDAVCVAGKLELTGNISINSAVQVNGDIRFSGDVFNSNNSVIFSENGNLIIENNNVNLNGLVYIPKGTVKITAQNLNLNNIIIIAKQIVLNGNNINLNYSSSMGEFIGSDSGSVPTLPDSSDQNEDETVSEETPVIYAKALLKETDNSVAISWESNKNADKVKVWTSIDNEHYELLSEVDFNDKYEYKLTNTVEKRYFKVSFKDENNYIESVPVVIKRNEDKYLSEFLDSDDGIPDIFEIEYGTDIYSDDSDKDGLSDIVEINITGTDPLVYDSVVKGVADADIDSDTDGLSNREELKFGTNPIFADTDADGLTDSQEINKYFTNPLSSDSDGDSLTDFDEVYLGLDPNKVMTYGVADAEYKINQRVEPDNLLLAEINCEESPYSLSIDVKASGNINNSLSVGVSSLTNAISEECLIGEPIQIDCIKSDSIEYIDISFKIKNDKLDVEPSDFDELGGLKRYTIFRYVEELQMYVPIETNYDFDNGAVYTSTDTVGSYCVVDLDNWIRCFDIPILGESAIQADTMKFMDVKNSNFSEEETRLEFVGDYGISSRQMLSESDYEDVSTPNNIKLDVPVEIVFLLQTSGQMSETFSEQKKVIIDIAEKISKKYDTEIRFSVITYNQTQAKVIASTDGNWITENSDLKEVLSGVTYQFSQTSTDRSRAIKVLRNDIDFYANSHKFVFHLMNGSSSVSNSYFDQLQIVNLHGINYSEVIPYGFEYVNEDYATAILEAVNSTGGISKNFSSSTVSDIYNHIVASISKSNRRFKMLLPSGSKMITLDGVLNATNGVNSDTDELTDWQEVNTDRVKILDDGSIELPCLWEYWGFSKKSYADDFAKRYNISLGASFDNSEDISVFIECLKYILYDIEVLPVYSNPTEPDTDCDGLFDDIEKKIGTNPFKIDTDGDGIDDEEEYFLGLNPLKSDTDGDGLEDGFELCIGFDPFEANADDDLYNDAEEYEKGLNPYVYEYLKTPDEHAADVLWGAIAGDFVEDTDDLYVIIGQISGSFIPVYADVRDTVANIIKGDWGMAGINLIGLIPTVGDSLKISGKLADSIKHIGASSPLAAKLVETVIKKCPGVVSYLAKNDDLAEAMRIMLAKSDMPRETFEQLVKHADDAGLVINKASDIFLKKGEKAIEIEEGIWENGWFVRGQIIDEYFNKHKQFIGLGETFPIADRVENRILISTKSIDLGAKSYKDSSRLKKRIQNYIKELEEIEKNILKF